MFRIFFTLFRVQPTVSGLHFEGGGTHIMVGMFVLESGDFVKPFVFALLRGDKGNSNRGHATFPQVRLIRPQALALPPNRLPMITD